MIIGLALIGFIYGLWFGGRYAEVMGELQLIGHSDQWLDGRLQEELRVGFSRIFLEPFQRDILRSMCTALDSSMVCGCTVRL